MTAEHQVRIGYGFAVAAFAAPMHCPSPIVSVITFIGFGLLSLRLISQTPFRRWLTILRPPSPSS